MKQHTRPPFLCAMLAAALGYATTTQAAPVLFATTGTTGNYMFIGIPATNVKWNTAIDGLANIYWDKDQDGVFGETAIGENTGNGASLGFTSAPISNGDSFNFAVEGFTSADTNAFTSFSVKLSDNSVVREATLYTGNSWTFTDSDNTQWKVTFQFIYQGYGDVVTNLATGAGGNTKDHKAVLTFTQVTGIPAPAAFTSGLALLAGCGAVGRVRRRG